MEEERLAVLRMLQEGKIKVKAVSRGYETASSKLDLDLETAHGSIVVS